MTLILRVKANWTGFVGAPGYSVFHFSTFSENLGGGANEAAQSVAGFFTRNAPHLPNNVSITVDPEVETIEDTTNTLESSFTIAGFAPIVGTGGLTYAAPTGAVVNWGSGTIRNGRRMRGRTFLVPLASSSYQADGSLIDSVRAALGTSATTMMDDAGSELLIYGRPTILGNDGVSAVVTRATVPDMAAILTSRRD